MVFHYRSFDFTDTRIDEALRLYLETFRLPGESPLIALIMEHFAEQWHVSLRFYCLLHRTQVVMGAI
jgi:brefeldin A-resistance guanine nucleotide exchange factor 1